MSQHTLTEDMNDEMKVKKSLLRKAAARVNELETVLKSLHRMNIYEIGDKARAKIKKALGKE